MKKVPVKLRGVSASIYAIVDDEDYEEMMKYTWRFNHGYAIRLQYVARRGRTTLQKGIFMHRQIIGTSKDKYAASGVQTDHINGNKLDNRKENLRFCTASQNTMNRRPWRGNSTGFRGVRKEGNRFGAIIGFQGGKKYIGSFGTAKEASDAYVKVAKELYGEFYPQ